MKKQTVNFLKLTPGCVKVFSSSLKPTILKLQSIGKWTLGTCLKSRFAVAHQSGDSNSDCQGWRWGSALYTDAPRSQTTPGKPCLKPRCRTAIPPSPFFNMRTPFLLKTLLRNHLIAVEKMQDGKRTTIHFVMIIDKHVFYLPC